MDLFVRGIIHPTTTLQTKILLYSLLFYTLFSSIYIFTYVVTLANSLCFFVWFELLFFRVCA